MKKTRGALRKALTDVSPHVRIAVAEALGRYGSEADLNSALAILIGLADSERNNSYIAVHALNAIDAFGKRAAPLKDQIAALPTVDPKSPDRVSREYARKLVSWLTTNL